MGVAVLLEKLIINQINLVIGVYISWLFDGIDPTNGQVSMFNSSTFINPMFAQPM